MGLTDTVSLQQSKVTLEYIKTGPSDKPEHWCSYFLLSRTFSPGGRIVVRTMQEALKAYHAEEA